MRAYVAEWFATFVLIFGGTGAIAVNGISNGAVTLIGIALTWGLLVAVLAYSVGPVSGAHMNPAVTLGLAYAGKHPWKLVPGYILAQFAGALTASLLLYIVTLQFQPRSVVEELGMTKVFRDANGVDWVWQCLALEIWLTGLLMFVVLSLSNAKGEIQALGGFIAGGVITLDILFCGPITGASMNPARSLGPAVVAWKLDYLWLYLVAPTLGAFAAVLMWQVIHTPEKTVVKS
jgi:aquaporin NIP